MRLLAFIPLWLALSLASPTASARAAEVCSASGSVCAEDTAFGTEALTRKFSSLSRALKMDNACFTHPTQAPAAREVAAPKALPEDSLKRESSYARVLLDYNGEHSSLTYFCKKFLKELYRSGGDLRSERARKRSELLSTYRLASGGSKTDFFHYTPAREMLDQFHPEESDRKRAHSLSLTDGTYERAFLWLRKQPKVASDQLLYVAEDPRSSGDGRYGSLRVTFQLRADARVLRLELSSVADVRSELEAKHPLLRDACRIDWPSVAYFAFEDSEIDLVDYWAENQWFQLVRPNAIERVELKY